MQNAAEYSLRSVLQGISASAGQCQAFMESACGAELSRMPARVVNAHDGEINLEVIVPVRVGMDLAIAVTWPAGKQAVLLARVIRSSKESTGKDVLKCQILDSRGGTLMVPKEWRSRSSQAASH